MQGFKISTIQSAANLPRPTIPLDEQDLSAHTVLSGLSQSNLVMQRVDRNKVSFF